MTAFEWKRESGFTLRLEFYDFHLFPRFSTNFTDWEGIDSESPKDNSSSCRTILPRYYIVEKTTMNLTSAVTKIDCNATQFEKGFGCPNTTGYYYRYRDPSCCCLNGSCPATVDGIY